MAIPFAAGAARLLYSMTRGALRQTKRLSAFKRSAPSRTVKIAPGVKVPSKVGGKTLRPWASKTLKGMEKVGISATKRRQALNGYQRGYKHVAKHKKLYGSGVAGAAAWDFLDND